MIVLTSTLLADLTVSPALTNPRIGWQNYLDGLTASSIAVSDESANGPRDAVLTPDTSEYWSPLALPATIVVDLGQAQTIDYVGLVHNFGTARASVKVEAGTDPSFAVSALFAYEIAPGDDSPLLFLDTARTARYLRLTINGSVVPKLSVIYAGQVLAMQRMLTGTYKPITMARKTILKRSMSRGGQFLGQTIRRNGVEGTAAFRNLDASWIRTYFDPFAKASRAKPYFFAWNPSLFPLEVGYVWNEKDIVPQYTGTLSLMDVAWNMSGVGST